MIRLNHVSKIYGDGSKKAVDDLSWDIEDGKITGFIGPNGAGKTTTLKMITGILAPSEGTVEINGKDIQKDPLEAKRQFGFVPMGCAEGLTPCLIGEFSAIRSIAARKIP